MIKKKLTLNEQIKDMSLKGITFTILNTDDAKTFLKLNTYYFKLKSYAQNYDRYLSTDKKGQYINLEFAYLVELYILDTYLKRIILLMALDIEHALKTQLLYDLSLNSEEDGYSLVNTYLSSDYMRLKSLHDKIGKSAASDLICKRQESGDDYALWEIVEVLTFGEFIDLYQLYYSTYPSKEPDYINFLWSIKFLRNAAAHNNCLLNSLKAPYNITIHKTKEIQFELSKIKSLSSNTREKWLSNPIIHDFITLVFVFLKIIKNSKIKQTGIKSLNWLFNERMLKHKDYFSKNNTITESYHFVTKVINYLCNKYRK